jgi:hypothetical protein
MGFSKADFIMGQCVWKSKVQEHFTESLSYQIFKVSVGVGASTRPQTDRPNLYRRRFLNLYTESKTHTELQSQYLNERDNLVNLVVNDRIFLKK